MITNGKVALIIGIILFIIVGLGNHYIDGIY